MKINKTLLTQKVQVIINDCYKSLDTSQCASDILIKSVSAKNIGESNLLTVPNISSLPRLADFENTDTTNALIYFIEDLGIFAIGANDKWLTLDGKLIRDDFFIGFAYGWGLNVNGQVGDATTTNRGSPVSLSGEISGWCQISAGFNHSVGVLEDGRAFQWGINGGRLGDGTTTDRSIPTLVVGGFDDWCQVSAGNLHTAGIRTNGTLWQWGCGSNGRLGNNSTLNRLSPVPIAGSFSDWCQVSAGGAQTVALRQNGTAWQWGFGSSGSLGNGTATDRSQPVSVVGDISDWCQVSVGSGHTAAVRRNGTIWSWGSGLCGRLGNNAVTNRQQPVQLVGGFSDWCQVSAGGAHSIGVRQDGSAWQWGQGQVGRLGDGTTTDKSSPVQVIGGFTDWCQIGAGGSHSMGIRKNGTLWAWGYNTQCQLGTNNNFTVSSPISVSGGLTSWCQVSGGGCHTLGITAK